MAKAKKPITRRAFVGNAAVSAGLLGITAAANVGTNMFRSLLDHYLGGRPSTVEPVAPRPPLPPTRSSTRSWARAPSC